MSLDLGAPDPGAMIQGEGWAIPTFGFSSLISNIFVANSPQILLSMIYFAYNNLFTSLLLGLEWNTFANTRKGLRVNSNPVGEQRGTRFLQLPFRWAIPLITLSAILHWLCSQSIFLVSAEFDHSIFRTDDGEHCYPPDSTSWDPIQDSTSLPSCQAQYFTCGYTPKAILITIILGILMIVFALLMGLRKYKNGGMPVVGSCSAAISASCHLMVEKGEKRIDQEGLQERVSHSKLKWGEFDRSLISESESTDVESRSALAPSERIYHCGFSHLEVNMPEKGKLYAGLR